MKITKKSQKEFVKMMLSTNKKWTTRALLKIYECQTVIEQTSRSTLMWNGIGFSGCDAEILSSFAEQMKAGANLSEKQMSILFKKMPKYWNQIITLSDINKLNVLVGR